MSAVPRSCATEEHGQCACGGPGPAAAGPDRSAPTAVDLLLSRIEIRAMDCPSEGEQVRSALGALAVAIEFDYPARVAQVWHRAPPEHLLAALEPLHFGARLLASASSGGAAMPDHDSMGQRVVLIRLLAINAAMFVVEMLAGWWAASAGLLADGLDMLADASVYGVALLAVGRGARARARAARWAGVTQLLLACTVFAGLLERLGSGVETLGPVMMYVAMLALAANATCLWLISARREQGAHMRASYIFSASDVLANLGVVLAGALVAWTGQAWPDWLIGAAIGTMVLLGAIRILRLPAD